MYRRSITDRAAWSHFSMLTPCIINRGGLGGRRSFCASVGWASEDEAFIVPTLPAEAIRWRKQNWSSYVATKHFEHGERVLLNFEN
jgi:hypothetical protein